jgi:hypothetical protein
MGLFDAYVFIDWSAAGKAHPRRPRKDAVWVGELVPDRNHRLETYHRTRADGVAHVTGLLEGHVREGRRVLVGFDFPYGYPAGFAQALGQVSGPRAWWSVWGELAARVSDDAANVNNRFAVAGGLNTALRGGPGPFWGCPKGLTVAHLSPRSPGFPCPLGGGVTLVRLRVAETRLPRTQETWKLFGNGSVGSQALLGMPRVYHLRQHPALADVSRVWPFETGFSPTPGGDDRPRVLHAEIWPGVVDARTQALLAADPSLIRDRAQVRAMCEWAAESDRAGTLGKYFDTPAGLTPEQVRACVEEEGWVLGAT